MKLDIPLEDTPRKIAAPLDILTDESLPGFLCRLADWNLIGAPSQLLRGIGTWPSGPLSELDLARLARRTGTDRLKLIAAYERSFGPGFNRRMRNWSRRRVSPASLRLSPHHRTIWQVSPLPYCPVTWTNLIDACPECTSYLDWDALTLCGACGYDLRDARVVKASEDERAALERFAAILIDGELKLAPAELPAELTPIQLAEVIVVVGRSFVAPDNQDTLRGQTESLLEGLRMVEGLPGAVVELAGMTANKKEHPFFGRLGLEISKRVGPVRAALSAIREMRPVSGMRRLREARTTNDAMTATELAASVGLERSSLRRMVDRGVLGPRKPRGQKRACDWFSHDDRTVLEGVIDGRLSAIRWASSVGLCLSDVRQLLSLGLLTEPPDEAVRQSFDGLQLVADQARELRSRLIDLAPVSNAQGLPVSHFFVLAGGGYKPWGSLIQHALEGKLEDGLFHVRDDLGRRIGDAWITPRDAKSWLSRGKGMKKIDAIAPDALGSYRPQTLAWTEVEDLLNCYPADVSQLSKLNLIQGLCPGRRPAFNAREAEALAQEFISGRELCARTGRSGNLITSTLRKAGWPKNEAGFWVRSGIEDVLPQLDPRPSRLVTFHGVTAYPPCLL